MTEGGLRAATIRGLLYVGLGRGAVDERGFEALRRIRKAHGDFPLSEFKSLVREQFDILGLDESAALAAIPSMLPPDVESRRGAFDIIKGVLRARGELSAEDNTRLAEVAHLFGLDQLGTGDRRSHRPNRGTRQALVS
jgi:hypothetical protein